MNGIQAPVAGPSQPRPSKRIVLMGPRGFVGALDLTAEPLSAGKTSIVEFTFRRMDPVDGLLLEPTRKPTHADFKSVACHSSTALTQQRYCRL